MTTPTHRAPPLVTVKAVYTRELPRGSFATAVRDPDDFNFRGRRASKQGDSRVHLDVSHAHRDQARRGSISLKGRDSKIRSPSPQSKAQQGHETSRSDSGKVSEATLSPPTHHRELSDVAETDESPEKRVRKRLTPVSKKPKIEHIDSGKITVSCNEGICRVSNLYLDGAHLNVIQIAMREKHANSKILKFENCRFTKVGILHLRNFNQQLTELDLSDSSVDLESEGSEFYLRFLGSLTKVRKISFAFWKGLPIQNTQFQQVAEMMHELEVIDLRHTDVRRVDLERFIYFPVLAEVNIGDCTDISNGGFKSLVAIRTLSRLLMPGCEISVKGFEQLGVAVRESSTPLTELDLSRTSFNDEWFKHLLHFQQLQKLTLVHCNQIVGTGLFKSSVNANIPDSLTHINFALCGRLQGEHLIHVAKSNVKEINLKQCDRDLVTSEHVKELLKWYKGSTEDDTLIVKSEYDAVDDLSKRMESLSLSPHQQARGTTPTVRTVDAQSNGSGDRASSAARSDDASEAGHSPPRTVAKTAANRGKKDKGGKGKGTTQEYVFSCVIL